MFIWSGNFLGHVCVGRFTRPCIVHTEFWRIVSGAVVVKLKIWQWKLIELACEYMEP